MGTDGMKDVAGQSLEDKLGLSVDELVEALSSPEKSAELIKRRGWTKDDLIRRAEIFSSYLSTAVSDVSRV